MLSVQHYSYSEEPWKQELYETIRSWDPKSFPPPKMLPKLGVIIWDGETPVCFLCADMSNSIPRAFIDFLMTNPEVGASTRYRAVKMAESFLCQRLRSHGYDFIFGVSRKAGVAALSQSMGYRVDPEPFVFFNKAL